MGFIKAFAGAIGGTFADQWIDFIVPMSGVPATAGIYPAVPQGTNTGRGSNTKGSNNIISNGSKIIAVKINRTAALRKPGISIAVNFMAT